MRNLGMVARATNLHTYKAEAEVARVLGQQVRQSVSLHNTGGKLTGKVDLLIQCEHCSLASIIKKDKVSALHEANILLG